MALARVAQSAVTASADDSVRGPAKAVRIATSEPGSAGVAWVIGAYLLLVVGYFGGVELWQWRDPTPFDPAAGVSIFAPLYVLAQALERFLDPFASRLGGTSEGGKIIGKGGALKNLYRAVTEGLDGAEIAKKQATLDRVRANTTVIVWGLASLLAMLACGAFGIFLLGALGFAVPPEVDIVISGIAVGAGTKPLHDLISNLQKSKEQKENPQETGGTV